MKNVAIVGMLGLTIILGSIYNYQIDRTEMLRQELIALEAEVEAARQKQILLLEELRWLRIMKHKPDNKDLEADPIKIEIRHQ